MARQIVNTGSAANDGTGDTLRTAGQKINDNFNELYTLLGGDSASFGVYTTLTDSGFDLNGVTYKTKVGFTEGAQTINIDFPDSAGEIVVDTATQTLTNKTLTAPAIDDPTVARLKLYDADSSHTYTLVGGALTGNYNINIPALTSNDTFTLNSVSQTLTNKTLTAPTIFSPIVQGNIKDSDDQPILHFVRAASSVNHIDIRNGATGNAPALFVEGDDTNINIDIFGAGTGAVLNQKVAYGKQTISATPGTASTSKSYISITTTTTASITVGNGSVDGEIKVITHDGSAVATLSFAAAANFAQGTSIALDPNDTVSLIWNNGTSEWNIFGGYGYTIS
jgi:hypothetical protein